VQYWTTRGFAVVDVNYGGSTGYGRAYRERLRGQWGIVDVDDSISAAQSLVARGLVDERRIAIRGGSAGGYTTLRALTTTDFFAAGTSLFGLAELISFAEETHKFESRYLDGLIGPYPARRDLYVERSPLTHIESLSTPVLLLQGLDDRVVPPSQSRQMAEGLRRRHVPFALIEYEGEGHGFRQAQNIVNAQESELSFYGRVFEFTPAGNPPPLVMENEENLAVSPV
jgi:dipeptidyl aminopeptidase/acylaminoacyl peptidase